MTEEKRIVYINSINEIDDWFMINARSKHITYGELKELHGLSLNDETKRFVEICPIHRNFCDILEDFKDRRFEDINATEILRNDPYSGWIKFDHPESKNILNMEMKMKIDTEWNFCLDIEYKEGCWYPVNTYGEIMTEPEEELIDDTLNNYSRNISNYEDDTRVGWRGAMVKINDFNNIVFRIQ